MFKTAEFCCIVEKFPISLNVIEDEQFILVVNVACPLNVAVLDAVNGTNDVLPNALLLNVCNCPNVAS